MKFLNHKTKAFTMIELLVVIAIIGILSALITPAVQSMMRDGRDTQRKNDINALRKAIWVQSNMGSLGYPIQATWCCVDVGDCTILSSALVPTYVPKLPVDPAYAAGNKEFCYMYKSNGITFDLYTKLENKGAISLSPNQVKISSDQVCDDGWINTGLGFCVMQYEARSDGTTNCRNAAGSTAACPVSPSAGTGAPWATISQVDAIAACKSIGAHLINNVEWMSLARDIESVSSNYTSGVLKRGNVGDAATGDYVGGTPESGAVANSLATLSLSNGQTINHFSGNVWEWVDYTITGASSQPQTPSQSSLAWQEINAITNWGNTLGYTNVGPKNTSLNSATGAGKISYQSTDTSTRGLRRGSYWAGTTSAGIFALSLDFLTTTTSNTNGFRCAK